MSNFTDASSPTSWSSPPETPLTHNAPLRRNSADRRQSANNSFSMTPHRRRSSPPRPIRPLRTQSRRHQCETAQPKQKQTLADILRIAIGKPRQPAERRTATWSGRHSRRNTMNDQAVPRPDRPHASNRSLVSKLSPLAKDNFSRLSNPRPTGGQPYMSSSSVTTDDIADDLTTNQDGHTTYKRAASFNISNGSKKPEGDIDRDPCRFLMNFTSDSSPEDCLETDETKTSVVGKRGLSRRTPRAYSMEAPLSTPAVSENLVTKEASGSVQHETSLTCTNSPISIDEHKGELSDINGMFRNDFIDELSPVPPIREYLRRASESSDLYLHRKPTQALEERKAFPTMGRKDLFTQDLLTRRLYQGLNSHKMVSSSSFCNTTSSLGYEEETLLGQRSRPDRVKQDDTNRPTRIPVDGDIRGNVRVARRAAEDGTLLEQMHQAKRAVSSPGMTNTRRMTSVNLGDKAERCQAMAPVAKRTFLQRKRHHEKRAFMTNMMGRMSGSRNGTGRRKSVDGKVNSHI